MLDHSFTSPFTPHTPVGHYIKLHWEGRTKSISCTGAKSPILKCARACRGGGGDGGGEGGGGFSGGGFSKKLVVYFLQVFSFHVGGEERWELCGV